MKELAIKSNIEEEKAIKLSNSLELLIHNWCLENIEDEMKAEIIGNTMFPEMLNIYYKYNK